MRNNYQPIIRGNMKRPQSMMEQFRQFYTEMQGVDANAELQKIMNSGVISQSQMGQIRNYAQQHSAEFGAPMQRRRR